jgi:FKBP-type peptidyl-prolyl cis-trans isomerase FklB
MKIKGLIVLTGVIALLLGSCGNNSIKNSKLVTENDTLSYAIGVSFYNQLIKDSIMLDPLIVAKAWMDAKSGKLLMDEAGYQGFLMRYSTKMQQSQMEKQAESDKVTYKDYIAENEAFLAKNKQNSKIIETQSGLQYEVIKMGSGPKPTAENTVKVHYVGTLINGTEFDSSVKRNEPAQFQVMGVIKGWTEALQLMPVGSKFKLFLPQDLAYGSSGAGEVIKPYSTLIFEVELLEIVK